MAYDNNFDYNYRHGFNNWGYRINALKKAANTVYKLGTAAVGYYASKKTYQKFKPTIEVAQTTPVEEYKASVADDDVTHHTNTNSMKKNLRKRKRERKRQEAIKRKRQGNLRHDFEEEDPYYTDKPPVEEYNPVAHLPSAPVPKITAETDQKNSNMKQTTLKSPPMVVYHRSRGMSRTPFMADTGLRGYKTIEFTTPVGRLSHHHSFWNTFDELKNMRTLAATNIISQLGIGNKAALTEGVTTAIAAQTYKNLYQTYITRQTRTWDVTNMGTTTCSINIRIFTSKRDDSPNFQDCLSDTTFEDFQGANQVQYFDGSAIVGADNGTVTNSIPDDDLTFDCMKHRYKVRRNWKQLGRRSHILEPGQSIRFTFTDQGPHLISDVYLDENLTNQQILPGYFRQCRFELRGIDVVASTAASDSRISRSPAAVAIIEHMTLTLRGSLQLRNTFRNCNTDLTSSIANNPVSGAGAVTTLSIGRLPTFANIAFINPEDENKETTMDQAA